MFTWEDPDSGTKYEMYYDVPQTGNERECVMWRVLGHQQWQELPPFAMPPKEAIEEWHGTVPNRNILTESQWEALVEAEKALRDGGYVPYTDVNVRDESELAARLWVHCEAHMRDDMEDEALSIWERRKRIAKRVSILIAVGVYGTDWFVKWDEKLHDDLNDLLGVTYRLMADAKRLGLISPNQKWQWQSP